jgi:hypothetical protein
MDATVLAALNESVFFCEQRSDAQAATVTRANMCVAHHIFVEVTPGLGQPNEGGSQHGN